MLKFVVVLYRRPDLPVEQFRSILRGEHAAMAERLPGLRKYVQNHVASDPRRKHPGWDAVVELYWDDGPSMEAAWATPEGQRATEHLSEFVDLSRSTWSVVEEEVRRSTAEVHEMIAALPGANAALPTLPVSGPGQKV